MSPTAPLTGVMLLTRQDIVYIGLVAETAAEVCLTVTVVLVPHVEFKVCRVLADASSLKKSIVIDDASKPLTNLCPLSPIAVTSSSSNDRLIVTLLTSVERSTAFTVRTTPLLRYTAIGYSSSFLVAGLGAAGAI